MTYSFLSKSAMDGIFEVQKDKRLVKAWASVEVVDTDGEIISIDALKRVMPIVMDRGGLVMFEHTNKPVGKIISYEFAKHPKTNEEGLLLLIKVFDHYKFDDEVWEAIKEGVITGISIGGVARDYEIIEKDGKKIKKYTNIETLEFSFVRRPANPLATIEQVNMLAKNSKDEQGGILINNDTNKNVMVDEKAKELYKALKEVAEVEKEKTELAKSVKEEVIKTLGEMKETIKEDIAKMKDEVKEDVIKSVEERLTKMEEVVKSLEGLLNKVVETLEKSADVPTTDDVEKEEEKEEEKKEVEKSAETPKPAMGESKEVAKSTDLPVDFSQIF